MTSLDRLAGVWRLLAFDFIDADGAVFSPLGTRPVGTLVVTSTGYTVFSFSDPDRAPFARDDLFAATADELARAAVGYVSFGGPCEVSDEALSVRVEFSLFPNWIGGTQVRLYQLEGQTLTLCTPGPRPFGGADRTARVVFERA